MIEFADLSASQHSWYTQDAVKEGIKQLVSQGLSAFSGFVPFTSVGSPSESLQKPQKVSSTAVSKEFSEVKQLWQERGASALLLLLSQLGQLFQIYHFRKPEEVIQFFQRYPSLISLITETHSNIRFYFLDAEIFLQSVTDPDTNHDNNTDLVISIVTRLAPPEAVEKLEQFYENWWFSSSEENELKGKIAFNLECI